MGEENLSSDGKWLCSNLGDDREIHWQQKQKLVAKMKGFQKRSDSSSDKKP